VNAMWSVDFQSCMSHDFFQKRSPIGRVPLVWSGKKPKINESWGIENHFLNSYCIVHTCKLLPNNYWRFFRGLQRIESVPITLLYMDSKTPSLLINCELVYWNKEHISRLKLNYIFLACIYASFCIFMCCLARGGVHKQQP